MPSGVKDIQLLELKDTISQLNEKSNPPAMLGRIVYVETVRISIKNLLCYIENGVASQTQT